MNTGAPHVFPCLQLITISSSVANGSAASIVSAGTVLNLRTTQPIAADSAQPGMTLTGVVDDPIAVNGEVVIPRGAIAMLEVVNVERSSNLKGMDRITLKVHSIQTESGTYPVATSQVELKGHSEGKKTARKVIGGAGIGAALFLLGTLQVHAGTAPARERLPVNR